VARWQPIINGRPMLLPFIFLGTGTLLVVALAAALETE
jgi:hypothetical protein